MKEVTSKKLEAELNFMSALTFFKVNLIEITKFSLSIVNYYVLLLILVPVYAHEQLID